MKKVIFLIMAVFSILFLCVLVIATSCGYNDTGTNLDRDSECTRKALSRRKRFIVFDEGSSFQLVFCNTFPTIFAIGDIFLFGYTAALAYELPQDPYSPFNHHADPLHRRMDAKMIYFTDPKGKVLWGKPYERRPIVNPAMAKRSVNQVEKQLMHASQNKRGFLKSKDMDGASAEFHRSGRAALYPKIEALLRATGSNGRHCVLRALCQVGQTQHYPQGSFFQEIMRAVFTLPKGDDSEELSDYDNAHAAVDSCAELYPDCVESANEIPTFSY